MIRCVLVFALVLIVSGCSNNNNNNVTVDIEYQHKDSFIALEPPAEEDKYSQYYNGSIQRWEYSDEYKNLTDEEKASIDIFDIKQNKDIDGNFDIVIEPSSIPTDGNFEKYTENDTINYGIQYVKDNNSLSEAEVLEEWYDDSLELDFYYAVFDRKDLYEVCVSSVNGKLYISKMSEGYTLDYLTEKGILENE